MPNYSKCTELTVARRPCNLQELLDGIAGNWAFAVRLPTESGGDMRGEVVQDLHVDVHAHPGGDDDEQGVGGYDGGIGFELLNELVGLSGEGATEGGGADVGKHAQLIGAGGLHAEHLHVRAVSDGEDGARNRRARRPSMARRLPCGAVATDLVCLDFAQGLGVGLGDQSGRHQVESVLGGLLDRSVGAGAVGNVLTQLGHHGDDRQGGAGLEYVGLLPVQRCGGGESVAVHCSHERFEVASLAQIAHRVSVSTQSEECAASRPMNSSAASSCLASFARRSSASVRKSFSARRALSAAAPTPSAPSSARSRSPI